MSQLVGLKDLSEEAGGETGHCEEELYQVAGGQVQAQLSHTDCGGYGAWQPYSLEGSKSLQDKKSLLDSAMEWVDRDVVLDMDIML